MDTKKPFSYIRGSSFSFEDEGNNIEAWFSSFTGLEKVFVNGELISKQRTFSKNTSHSFKIGENEYSVNFLAKSLLKGPFTCTLYKNNNAYKRQKLVFIKLRGLLNTKFIILFVTLAIIIAVSRKFAILPEIFIFFIALIGVLFLFSKSVLPIGWIEDDEIV